MMFRKKKKESKRIEMEDMPIEQVVEEPKETDEIKRNVVKEEIQKEFIYKVVDELPTQKVREYIDKSGQKIILITIEEALTQFINE